MQRLHLVVSRIDYAKKQRNQWLFFKDQTSVQPKRMMYSTPMDTIQVEFDEHNKPDDHLVR